MGSDFNAKDAKGREFGPFVSIAPFALKFSLSKRPCADSEIKSEFLHATTFRRVCSSPH
jgi:hypothetical protein